MRIEHESAEKFKKEILRIVGKGLDLRKYKVFFFGSRVMGKGNERSDIDIGIEGPAPVPLGVMSDIEDEIEELPLLYKIDVVDFQKTSEKFKKVAQEHIEILN